MFEPSAEGANGGGFADTKVCTRGVALGRVQGNMFHGHLRFGTYFIGDNFPKNTDQSLSNDGFMTDMSTCNGFLSDGSDNGLSSIIEDNVDWKNVFVGQYDAGDIQYKNHAAISTLNLIYWKSTKPFADSCSSHIKGGTFAHGQMALPDAPGAFIIEDVVFNDAVLEANHHCSIGITGILCSPTYVLKNVQYQGRVNNRAYFTDVANNYGGIFTLAPGEEANTDGVGNFFPATYCALVSTTFQYLLALDSGNSCSTSASLGLNAEYPNGILCKRPLRSLKIYTRTPQTATLKVELWQGGSKISELDMPFYRTGGTKKQGYAFPVAIGTDHEYKILLGGGQDVPSDWIIEFSDPIFGNRFPKDEIKITVQGRSCPAVVDSMHDRRFVYADSLTHLGDDAWGHGACTSHPAMPLVTCASQAPLASNACPSKCPGGCDNGYCDCGTGQCACNPGFSGTDCSVDVCAAARCGGE